MSLLIAVLPKKKLSGGSLELTRLLDDLARRGIQTIFVYIFPNSLSKLHALLFFPIYYVSAIVSISRMRPSAILLSHYSTLFLAFIPFKANYFAFVQDLEWMFPSKSHVVQSLLKYFHCIAFSRLSFIVAGNRYLYEQLLKSFPSKSARLSNPGFLSIYPVGESSLRNQNPCSLGDCQPSSERNIEILLMLKNGWLKNASLYIRVLNHMLSQSTAIMPFVTIINLSSLKLPDAISSSHFIDVIDELSQADLFCLYRRTKLYLCLSLHEGFGLPPLEAMSFGAIPLVLQNGGCSCYLSDYPSLVLPRSSSEKNICDHIDILLGLTHDQRLALTSKLVSTANEYFSYARVERDVQANVIVDKLS